MPKQSLAELAVFGAHPAFEQALHVGRPNLPDRARLLERIEDVLDRRWLTNQGPLVSELEQRIAEYLEVEHCIAMCNGTVALEIAIRALGLTGEVLVPSYTFVATAHALQWQGIKPVFCDLDPATHNIDPAKIEDLISAETSGILGVHLWGRPCEVEKLEAVAQGHGLALLYDAAHAFGCSYKGRMIGNFGAAEVMSFHATKFFNTFEGGAVTTNDPELASQVRLMKNFGFTGYDEVGHLGTNGKMNEVCAAMGLASFESIDDFLANNRRNYETYRKGLETVDGVRLVLYDADDKCNYQYIVIEVDEPRVGISRDLLIEILQAENVLARRYFYPGCHRMEPYRSACPEAGAHLPHTEQVAARVVTLPNGTAVSQEDIEQICSIIRCAVDHGREIADRVGSTAG